MELQSHWNLGPHRRFFLDQKNKSCTHWGDWIENATYPERKHYEHANQASNNYFQFRGVRHCARPEPQENKRGRGRGSAPVDNEIFHTYSATVDYRAIEPFRGVKLFPGLNACTTRTTLIEDELGKMGIVRDANGVSVRLQEATELLNLPNIPRKKKFSTSSERRNGYPEKNAGDKGYAVAEYAPGFYENPNGIIQVPLSKMDVAWSQSATDPHKDKDGRPLCEHIQLYVTTPFRKLSMFAHRDISVGKLLQQITKAEALGPSLLYCNGKLLQDQDKSILDYGIFSKCTVRVEVLPPVTGERHLFTSEKMKLLKEQQEVQEVKSLSEWNPPGLLEMQKAKEEEEAAAAAANAAKNKPAKKK